MTLKPLPLERAADDVPWVRVAAGADDSSVSIGTAQVGPSRFSILAGPCAVESVAQIGRACRGMRALGVDVFRAGAFKPRTSPYSFQGWGMDGLAWLQEAARSEGLPFVTEVPSVSAVDLLEPSVDAFQVGTRNMHNFELLKRLGQTRVPVVLKRGFGATLREWLLAAEYIAQGGNDQIILCERGIRSFVEETRFTLDLAGAVWVKEETRLPVIVDPSHATGLPRLVGPMTKAALAAGLDGAMVEVHPCPAEALSDADQQMTEAELARLIRDLIPLAEVLGRQISAGLEGPALEEVCR
jgi:3-deoxy-7-phosphoheptulonate synthase